ncbi:MAG: hypothetical protein ACT4OY_01350 [Alphaproteobacteria bacterium]
MTAKTKASIPIKAWEKLVQKISNKERTKANSEYHIQNFSRSDTAAYLERVNRKDIDPEKLYLELNRAVLFRDLMMDEILSGERCSPQFDKAFKDDLVKIIKHTKKLCDILGVDRNGEIEINWSGQKAFYSYFKRKEGKPKRKDNLHWGLSIMGFTNKKWTIPAKVLKRAQREHPFGFPVFTDRLKDIARDINFLRVVAENMQNVIQGDRAVMDSDYYRSAVSFGMTPEEWMIGRKLPEIYKEFFGGDPQIVRSRIEGGEPHGDGLHFLMWCLERIGISLSKETVTTYYYNNRIGSNA